MNLSIIIVNYNTNRLTIDCISSIYKETKKVKFEIIVIDNCSKKENPKHIKQSHPKIKLITNEKNLGFGQANNLGLLHTKGKHILLLNSDTIILNHALDKCFAFMESNYAISNNIGLLGCTLLNSDGTFQNSTFGHASLFGYFIYGNPILNKIARFKKKFFDFSRGQFVVGVSGAFMWFKKEVFDKIKPFDPDFFMYSEEMELCRNRVSKYFSTYYWPAAQIIHFGGKSGNSEHSYHQNMLSFALTWYKKGVFHYALYMLISTINFLSHFALFPLVLFNERSRINYQKVILGYLKIFRYYIFDIPRYSTKWGGRLYPLKLQKK